MQPASGAPGRFAFVRSRAALVVLLALGLVWVYVEHRVHLLGVLPYLFLLACPLMHVFMHRGHHGHRARSGSAGLTGRYGRDGTH